jgi:hypothetical protein
MDSVPLDRFTCAHLQTIEACDEAFLDADCTDGFASRRDYLAFSRDMLRLEFPLQDCAFLALPAEKAVALAASKDDVPGPEATTSSEYEAAEGEWCSAQDVDRMLMRVTFCAAYTILPIMSQHDHVCSAVEVFDEQCAKPEIQRCGQDGQWKFVELAQS